MSSNLFSLSLNQEGGSNQYAVISTDETSYAYNSGTIECWIYITGTGAGAGGYQAVVVKQGAYSIYLFNNQLIAYDWNTNSSAYSNITLNTNTWYHIAFVFQSGVENGSTFYINGYPVSSFKYTCFSQSQKLSIASGVSSFSAQPFNGYIDELRIWNTVRNDQQILQKYNIRINSNTEGLTGYWLFDDGSGTVATNLVNGGPSLTLYNSTGWSYGYVAPINGGNLVKNGNFDIPTITTDTYKEFQNVNWFMVSGFYSTVGITKNSLTGTSPTTPSNFSQFVFMYNSGQEDRIAQEITFPKTGTYILNFWSASVSTNQKLFVKIGNLSQALSNYSFATVDGSILSNTINFTTANTWVKYSIQFTINSNSTFGLSFGNEMLNNSNFIFIGGVSITSIDYVPDEPLNTNYTIDLFFEWIADEDVEKNKIKY